MLECHICHKVTESEFSTKILEGDKFYVYKCVGCSKNGVESFERINISWANLIQIVMFHLYLLSGQKQRYFRLREDILETLDTRWHDLSPSKPKPQSLLNSLSKVLSTNDRLFASGLAVKGTHGWWGLHIWEAPRPPASAFPPIPKEPAPPSIVAKRSYESLRSSEIDLNDNDSDLSVSDEDMNEASGDAKPVPSAQLKQQLLERLLMMDSSILTDAIKKAKAKKIQDDPSFKVKRPKIMKIDPDYRQESPLPHSSAEMLAFLAPFQQALVTSTALNRAGPHENELLKRCIGTAPRSGAINRLLRKLTVRKQKRKAMLPVFDLDTWIYNYLRVAEEPLLLAVKEKGDSQPSSPKEIEVAKTFSLTCNPQDIPYIVDPSRSMYVKLSGMRSLYGDIPYPISSPFTGKLLDAFVWRDTAFACPKMKLLKEIRDFGGLEDELDFETDGEDDTSNTVTHQESLDYVHIRKEFIGQCNDLLSISFWPGIDVTDALDYPDYTMMALYRHAVVGCALVTPDGYLSYLHVRPDFQGHGIAKTLLALLLQNVSSRKDITLHVSVTNASAIALYQKFGFKPEEFIVNFYEKYYPADFPQEHSKNAFLMRLKR